MHPDETGEKWISAAEASRRLGCTARQVPKLSARGMLTVRRLPGCDPRYLLSDVDRLASHATVSASAEPTDTSAHDSSKVKAAGTSKGQNQ